VRLASEKRGVPSSFRADGVVISVPGYSEQVEEHNRAVLEHLRRLPYLAGDD
jgi:hypothetical protein